MTRGARTRPPALVLPAAKVAAWRLAQQYLSDEPAADPATAAAALVGVQAQVLSAAALSIAIRSGLPVGATTTALAERRLVRSWAMRGTLHLFAADDLPIVVSGRTRGQETA